MVVGGNPQFLREAAVRLRAESRSESQACGEFGAALNQAAADSGDAEVSGALADLLAVLTESTGLAVDLTAEAASALEANAQALDRAFGGGEQ